MFQSRVTWHEENTPEQVSSSLLRFARVVLPHGRALVRVSPHMFYLFHSVLIPSSTRLEGQVEPIFKFSCKILWWVSVSVHWHCNLGPCIAWSRSWASLTSEDFWFLRLALIGLMTYHSTPLQVGYSVYSGFTSTSLPTSMYQGYVSIPQVHTCTDWLSCPDFFVPM